MALQYSCESCHQDWPEDQFVLEQKSGKLICACCASELIMDLYQRLERAERQVRLFNEAYYTGKML